MSPQARLRKAVRQRPGKAGSVAGSLVGWLLPLACLAAGDERAAILAERQALLARFAAQERACASRFVVNACLDDVRLKRREALEPLRERELRLDQAERLKRAEERRAAIAAKQGALQRQAEREAAARKSEPQPVPGAASTPKR